MKSLKAALLSLALLAPLALANHTPIGACDGSDPLTGQGIIEVALDPLSPTMYVDDRDYLFGHGIWLYEESNGIYTARGPGVFFGGLATHNLQRGGEWWLNPIVPDETGLDYYELCVDDPTVAPDKLLL